MSSKTRKRNLAGATILMAFMLLACIKLGKELFVGKVLHRDGQCGTPCPADPASLARGRDGLRLAARAGIVQGNGIVGARLLAQATADAQFLVDKRHNRLDLHSPFAEQDRRSSRRALSLRDAFTHGGWKARAATQVNAVGGKIQGAKLDVGL